MSRSTRSTSTGGRAEGPALTVPPPPSQPPGQPPDEAVRPAGRVACYRHPDRLTAISCSRCGRPICPEDMHDAPVGFHCPVCVKEGRAVAPRTIAGGRVAAQSGTVSMVLVAANVLVYLLHGDGNAHRGNWALQPILIKYNHDYYRLFTAGFVHYGFLHIAFNMVALFSIGPQLEAMLGRLRFSALYLVSLAGSSALSYLLLPIRDYGGGASGAIFGLMGGLFVVARRMNLNTSQLNVWILYSLGFSFIPGINIDWRAHVGGLVTGAAVTWGIVHAPRQNRALIQTAAILAGFVVAAALVIIRTATFPALN